MAKISIEEKKWRAEADADTLARYEEIMSDSARRNAAIKAARTRAEELTQRASAMSRAANASPRPKKK